MHQERAGVDNMVPDHRPRRAPHRARRGSRIPVRRVHQIERAGYLLHRLRHGGVIEHARALAYSEMFVGVFVDWVGWLDRPVDLHYEVDPGVVLRADDEVVWDGGLVEKERLRFLQLEGVAAVSQGPAVRGVVVADCEEVCCVDGGGGRDDRVRDDACIVEEDGVCCCVLAGQGHPGIGGSIQLRRSPVAEDRGRVEDLLWASADHADCVVPRWLIERHHDGVSA